MRTSKYDRLTSRPIGRRGRLALCAAALVVAIVAGTAASTGLYQYSRPLYRDSAVVGRLLCGPDRRVDDVRVEGRRLGIRMICRDAAGQEVGPRNNGVAILMALPFVLLIAAPALLFAWKADVRVRRSRSR